MPVFRNQRRVVHSAQQMFDLVADVERYPEFVPLCERLLIRQKVQNDDGESPLTTLTATMTVAYKLFRESFTSRVVLDPAAHRLVVTYVDGPFRHLENRWIFTPLETGGCEIDFYLSYEFRSRALAIMMGAVFDPIFSRFSAAFERRADQIYGLRLKS